MDASVDGIGRGAGNLNLELIARYLNVNCGANYNLEPIYEVFDNYIKPLKQKYEWGGTPAFFLSSINNVNPNYASDYSNDLSLLQMQELYDSMQQDDRVLYTKELSKKYRQMMK